VASRSPDKTVAEKLASRLAAEVEGRDGKTRSLTFGAYLTGQSLPGKANTLAEPHPAQAAGPARRSTSVTGRSRRTRVRCGETRGAVAKIKPPAVERTRRSALDFTSQISLQRVSDATVLPEAWAAVASRWIVVRSAVRRPEVASTTRSISTRI